MKSNALRNQGCPLPAGNFKKYNITIYSIVNFIILKPILTIP